VIDRYSIRAAIPGVHDHAQCLPKSGEARKLAQVATVDPGVCKTVGSAYVGSNPTPATSWSRRSWLVREDRPAAEDERCHERSAQPSWFQPSTWRRHLK